MNLQDISMAAERYLQCLTDGLSQDVDGCRESLGSVQNG